MSCSRLNSFSTLHRRGGICVGKYCKLSWCLCNRSGQDGPTRANDGEVHQIQSIRFHMNTRCTAPLTALVQAKMTISIRLLFSLRDVRLICTNLQLVLNNYKELKHLSFKISGNQPLHPGPWSPSWPLNQSACRISSFCAPQTLWIHPSAKNIKKVIKQDCLGANKF